MADRRAQETLDNIGQLPVLPSLADELLSMAISTNADLERVLGVVEHDPVLAAMVLRMVNSAVFAIARDVTDLHSAVVLLGASHVRSLALAASMSALANSPDGEWQFRHGFDVACVARTINQAAGLPVRGSETGNDAETAFAAGILHDIGELIVGLATGHRADPNDPPAARIATEREQLGCDHTQLGEALAERWRLPAVLCAAIAHHHHVGAKPWIAAVVAAAENGLDGLDGTCHGDGTSALEALAALDIADPQRIVERCAAEREAHTAALSVTGGRSER